MIKKVFIILSLAIIISCSQSVYLQKSPSQLVLTSITPNYDTKISYNFTSKLPDKFEANQFIFDVNQAYESNLKIYFETKFSVDSLSNIVVNISLNSCKQTIKDVSSKDQKVANFFFAIFGSDDDIRYDYLIATEIDLDVSIEKEGKIIAKKNINITDQFNTPAYDRIYFAQSFDQAIGKSIILLDKFLVASKI